MSLTSLNFLMKNCLKTSTTSFLTKKTLTTMNLKLMMMNYLTVLKKTKPKRSCFSNLKDLRRKETVCSMKMTRFSPKTTSPMKCVAAQMASRNFPKPNALSLTKMTCWKRSYCNDYETLSVPTAFH